MTVYEWLGVASVMMALIALIPELITYARGETKPHAFSWIGWGLLGLIQYFGMIEAGGGAGSYLFLFIAIIFNAIGLSAFFYGERNITISDKISSVIVIIAAFALLLSRDPLHALILAAAGDIFSFYPTIRKSWVKPWTENIYTFYIYVGSITFSFFSVETKDLATIISQLTLLFLYISFIGLLHWRRIALKTSS